MSKRTFPQLLATIIINEVEPRRRKHGFGPPPEFSAALTLLEHEGEHDRRRTRQLLDEYFASFH